MDLASATAAGDELAEAEAEAEVVEGLARR
jgi:hypothetical protein